MCADLETITYAALLTPQGKYIADFFLVPEAGGDPARRRRGSGAGLLKKLNMYKLRADVAIEKADMYAIRGIDQTQRPRAPTKIRGTRRWGGGSIPRRPATPPSIDWDQIRVTHLIPEVGHELTPETYILEAGFERLNGVDFRKGCYVGQEVTARMKHKTELRKGFAGVALDGPAPEAGTKVTTEDGKEVGELTTVAPGRAIAYLRFDRAKGPLLAGDTRVIREV